MDVRVLDVEMSPAEVIDRRAEPPFRITGPSARVVLRVDGRRVTVDVTPLEIVEFRARIGAPDLLRRSARDTAAALAVHLVQSRPSTDGYRLVDPQVAQVHPEEAEAWRQLFAVIEESAVALESAGA